jgi:hypothetical protein
MENTQIFRVYFWGERKALGSLRSPRKCGGSSPFDFAQGQNDDVKLTTARTIATAKATARAKTKYRDLSTAAAKCAAFGRDDVVRGLKREQATARTSNRKNKQPQEQQQRQEQQQT